MTDSKRVTNTVHIHTAGELHPAPEVQADITLNLSRLLSNPAHVLPERLRSLDGTDGRVEDLVFATPGAKDVYRGLVELLDSALGHGKDVTVLILCRGGKHRSVAFGENLAHDFSTTATHHHKDLPVVKPA
ncbi:MAG TPA: RNase adapter RapZ [Candidatus Deferrimicrobiaceae bacterium]|nr:RNase adapter RapZ [Candidatus Deferrimicrobiaceae bacterium]